MAENQQFILTSGVWIGEGKITISASPDFIKFYTKWEITEENPEKMKAIQTVEMQGVDEHVINIFTFYDITPTRFAVQLENQVIGSVIGNGIIDSSTIAWEFRGSLSTFEGFEIYEMQENGDYSLHAEYTSADQLRTTIEGLIWRKSS